MEINTIMGMIGGLGVGSLLNTVVINFINQKSQKKERIYEGKKDAYIGLLTSLRDVASNPSNHNLKTYAL